MASNSKPMNPKRKARLYMVLFLLAGVAVTVSLALVALSENLNMFYPPDKVVNGEAPIDRVIRAGGMVKDGSVQRGRDLAVRFTLTDHAGSDFDVHYQGILPDLFREGQGILVQGKLNSQRQFEAQEVLAKHDENYMPPELAKMKDEIEAKGANSDEPVPMEPKEMPLPPLAPASSAFSKGTS